MVVYLLLFAVFCLWYISPQKYHHSDKVLFLSLLFLCLFVGISDMLGGYDRYIYSELFDDLANVRESGGNILSAYIFQEYPRELGYDLINILITFVTSNRYIFILLITLVIYALLFVDLKSYVADYPFALILFLGLMFFFTFTYLRQMIGVMTAWLSIRYAVKKQFWKYLLVFLIAATIHNSAVIFFPVYFLVDKRPKLSTVYLLMAGCLFLGLTGLPNLLFGVYGDLSGMEERAASYANDSSGFRIEYVLEALFFLYFIIRYYAEIPETKINIVMVNMSLIFCGILLVFVRSLNGGRLGWYYMIGVISVLTYLSTKLYKRPYYKSSLILMALLLYTRVILQWGVLLSPYKTFFTNGHREGDFIYAMYEYDLNYDKDKMYR